MTETQVAAREGGPAGLTEAEQLTALDTYQKSLKTISDGLRARVTEDLGARHVEKVGAYLPDGEKIGSVAYQPGNKTAKVNDAAAALRWCLAKYPDEIVQAVNPAFLTALLDYAKKKMLVGEHGIDPRDGESLDFIDVVQGSPFVRVTTTDEGVARMQALALGFAGMLEAAK